MQFYFSLNVMISLLGVDTKRNAGILCFSYLSKKKKEVKQ